MPEAVLEARGLTRRFGGLLAVDAVDITLMQGEAHCVIGPNGAGKTTLINVLSGDLTADGASATTSSSSTTPTDSFSATS